MVEDKEANLVFNNTIKITPDNGEMILFWKDIWLHGFTVNEIAPRLWKMVATRARNTRTLQQALVNNAWTEDVVGEINFTVHIQIAHLCLAISTAPRNENMPHQFHWPAEKTGVYTANATYDRLCMGKERDAWADCIRRSWAPLRCKIFAWVMVQYRLWTSDRRAEEPSSVSPACKIRIMLITYSITAYTRERSGTVASTI
ncbi:hypothetical protein D1007_02235 [Hordeum vulgare]|nr:hypothetical protein D1007_02235 [Hordeum vulgare]